MQSVHGDSSFSCRGKYAGALNRGATPGGMLVKEVVISVATKVPWKQKKVMNIKVICFGDDVELVDRLKTGDEIKIEGIIEQTGKKGKEEVKLIATKIEKEK